MKHAHSSTSTLATKNHFHVLDGLRGVAAIIVVLFHTFEIYGLDDPYKLAIGHGYLAVDFFFLLSGFVVAYAYDDRWDRMSVWGFFKRRMVRLQPMVVAGNVLGAALFYLGTCKEFAPIAQTPVWKLLLVMLIGCTVIPIRPAMDIRGWAETHPLDGPLWSLFYEYIANIAYALGLRKLSSKVLGLVTFASALYLIHLTVFGHRGDVQGGWTLTASGLHFGFARLLFPFMAGMLLMRLHQRVRVPSAFAVCSVMLTVLLVMPRIGPPNAPWINGIYEAACIIAVFPLIVLMGAGSDVQGKTLKTCKFLGDLSYPLYVSHYAFNYEYAAWIYRNHVTIRQGWWVSVALCGAYALIAYVIMRLYDEPVRRWLAKRYLARAS